MSSRTGGKAAYIKLSRAAEILGVPQGTLKTWIRHNRNIQAVKLGKIWYVKTSWLERVLTEGFTFEDKKKGGTP